jgi:hypothetical protein
MAIESKEIRLKSKEMSKHITIHKFSPHWGEVVQSTRGVGSAILTCIHRTLSPLCGIGFAEVSDVQYGYGIMQDPHSQSSPSLMWDFYTCNVSEVLPLNSLFLILNS